MAEKDSMERRMRESCDRGNGTNSKKGEEGEELQSEWE